MGELLRMQGTRVLADAVAGYLTLRVEHPHEPGWKVLQVCAQHAVHRPLVRTIPVSLHACITPTVPVQPFARHGSMC